MDSTNKENGFTLPQAKKEKNSPSKTPQQRMEEFSESAETIVANHQRVLEETKEMYGRGNPPRFENPEFVTPPKTLQEKITAEKKSAEEIFESHKEYVEEAKEHAVQEGQRAATRALNEQTLSESSFRTSLDVTALVNQQIASINLKVSGYRMKVNYRILLEWAADKLSRMETEKVHEEVLPFCRRNKKK